MPVQDPYNPAKAQALLAKAGYPHGFTTTIPCSPAGTGIPSTGLMMEAIQSNLAQIGITVKLNEMEWNSYVTQWLKGIPTGKGIGAECMSIGTDDAYILDMYANGNNAPPAGWNVGYYSNANVTKLLGEAAGAATYTQYIKLHQEAQKNFVASRADIFVLHDTGPYALNKRVKGWVPARSWMQDLSRAWLTST